MRLTARRILLAIAVAFGLGAPGVAFTTQSAQAAAPAATAQAVADDPDDDDDGGSDDDARPAGDASDDDDDRPKGGVDTGLGGTAESDADGSALLVPLGLS